MYQRGNKINNNVQFYENLEMGPQSFFLCFTFIDTHFILLKDNCKIGNIRKQNCGSFMNAKCGFEPQNSQNFPENFQLHSVRLLLTCHHSITEIILL